MKSFAKLLFYLAITDNNNQMAYAGSLMSSFPHDLIETSLVMLEAAIPAPHTLIELQEKRNSDI